MLQSSGRRSPSASLLPQFPLTDDAPLFVPPPAFARYSPPVDDESALPETDPFAAAVDEPPSYEIARNGSASNGSENGALVRDEKIDTRRTTDVGTSGVESANGFAPRGAGLNGSHLAESPAAAVEAAFNGTSHAYLAAAPSSSDVLVSGRSDVPPVPQFALPLLAAAEPVADEESDAINASRLPPHPHTGSLFVPYLVTEIRELRSATVPQGPVAPNLWLTPVENSLARNGCHDSQLQPVDAPMFRSLQPSTDSPLPLLITGVSGVVGYNALPYFSAPLSRCRWSACGSATTGD